MNSKCYELKILPLFEDNLNEIVDYITFRLKNPIAAEQFVDDVETAIYERLKSPFAFAPYESKRNREHVYYTIPVRNYTIFYVMIGDIREVRTIIYSRRDLKKLI
ncbi:MAG: type II toxin-antitoxin system RelE/ParE family toxin [Oscillospiraceae bacterium]|nr:type II toxin-antitoxin system RelE/ParE family toxin [Oscillospiraceae bacterium]